MRDISFELPDNDERGVSPVIGVILMVAITVILAAVIASFVLGFGGSVSSNASAGVDVQPNANATANNSSYNVTIVSLGENTQGIKCTGTDGDTNVIEGVGKTVSDCQGSVVAVAADGSNANNATVRTLD